MKFYIETLGCKVNQYDASVLSVLMEQNGFEQTLFDTTADIVIINSCTVTENSDKKARHAVAKIKRERPHTIIVLTGCYVQAFPDEAAATEADITVGTAQRNEIPQLLKSFIENGVKIDSQMQLPRIYEEAAVPAQTDKTRAYIKIEDGCDRFCSYCIIPFARGRVRSRSLENIRNEVEIQCNYGHREIVLVGINLSCYGKDLGLNLADAIEAVAANEKVLRVRLSSLEPELLDEKTIARMAAQPKLCPHFHLSLQSGCDETLKRMNRHYTADEYAKIVNNLRAAFPNCAITTDIMVGFAGETDEEFEKSLAFARKIGFAKIHVFTYSIREGTAAAKRTDHVSDNVKAERYKKMSALDSELQQKYLHAQIGTVTQILVQKRTHTEFAYGLTPNYTEVRIYGSNAQKHDVINVKIVGVEDSFCVGEEL